MEFDDLSKRVICYGIEGHRALGSRLLESTYEQCLTRLDFLLAISALLWSASCRDPGCIGLLGGHRG